MIAGLAGVHHNGSTALCSDGHVLSVCQQERVVRSRRVGLSRAGFPREALQVALAAAGRRAGEIDGYAAGEIGVVPPVGSGYHLLDHHLSHAATAAYTSPFEEAAVIVCDHHSEPQLSFWRASAGELVRLDWQWEGVGFARLYSEITALLNYRPDRDEHHLESLARVGLPRYLDQVAALVRFHGDGLEVDRRLRRCITEWLHDAPLEERKRRAAEIASSVQQHLGNVLVEVVEILRDTVDSENLCLAGGLFYNTYFNTLIERSGCFERTFIPPDPGNPGLAVGAGLVVCGTHGVRKTAGEIAASAYLGPAYSPQEIKDVLDNCKLSYDYLSEDRLVTRIVDALRQGRLVGLFQGRMEWTPRALGNRSILAWPKARYVLDNLNVFLKRRESYRGYGVSVCAEDVAAHFSGPALSPFMEFDYDVNNRDDFQECLPAGASRLRVHTVDDDTAPMLRRILKALGALTALPVVVNTSFNGFNEPIVCSPRDAVRAFYGTGLDIAAIGPFVLSK